MPDGLCHNIHITVGSGSRPHQAGTEHLSEYKRIKFCRLFVGSAVWNFSTSGFRQRARGSNGPSQVGPQNSPDINSPNALGLAARIILDGVRAYKFQPQGQTMPSKAAAPTGTYEIQGWEEAL